MIIYYTCVLVILIALLVGVVLVFCGNKAVTDFLCFKVIKNLDRCSLVSIAGFCGIGAAASFLCVVQDIVGKEAYIAWLSKAWLDSHITFPIELLSLIGCCLFYVLLRIMELSYKEVQKDMEEALIHRNEAEAWVRRQAKELDSSVSDTESIAQCARIISHALSERK